MELREIVLALLHYDALTARQWVADFMRSNQRWADVGRPEGMTGEQLALAAGVAELLAERAGESAPSWTGSVAASPRRIFLVRAAETMPRLRKSCEEDGPEPLRRRQLFAPPNFLRVA
jgi:hypothetical protein